MNKRDEIFLIIMIIFVILFSMTMCVKIEYFNPEQQIERSIEESRFKVGDWVATNKSGDPFKSDSLDHVYLITDIKIGTDGKLYYKYKHYSLEIESYFEENSVNEVWLNDFYRKVIIDKEKEAEIKSWK